MVFILMGAPSWASASVFGAAPPGFSQTLGVLMPDAMLMLRSALVPWESGMMLVLDLLCAVFFVPVSGVACLLDDAGLSTSRIQEFDSSRSDETFMDCSGRQNFSFLSREVQGPAEKDKHSKPLLRTCDSPREKKYLLCPAFRGLSPLQGGHSLQPAGLKSATLRSPELRACLEGGV